MSKRKRGRPKKKVGRAFWQNPETGMVEINPEEIERDAKEPSLTSKIPGDPLPAYAGTLDSVLDRFRLELKKLGHLDDPDMHSERAATLVKLKGLSGWVQDATAEGTPMRKSILDALNALARHVEAGDPDLVRSVNVALALGLEIARLAVAPENKAWKTGKSIHEAVRKGGKAAHRDGLSGQTIEEKYAHYCEVIEAVRNENPKLTWNNVYRIAGTKLKKQGYDKTSPSTLRRAWQKYN